MEVIRNYKDLLHIFASHPVGMQHRHTPAHGRVSTAASRAAICGATRKALAAIVRLGLIAPLRGMNEASTT